MQAKDTSKVIDEAILKRIKSHIPLNFKKLQSRKCKIHNKRITCVCIAQKAEKVALCTKCIIEDTEFFTKYSKKNLIIDIDDLQETLEKVANESIVFNKKEFDAKIDSVKDSAIEVFTSTINSEFKEICEEVIEKFKTNFVETLKTKEMDYFEGSNPAMKDTKQNPQNTAASFTTESDWANIDHLTMNAEQFCDKQLIENLDTKALAQLFKSVYIELKSHPIISYNIAIHNAENTYIKTALNKSEVKNKMKKILVGLAQGITSNITSSLGFHPDRSQATMVRRFNTVNNAYHYQVVHRHNSISFKVDNDCYFYGYSAFVATQGTEQPLVIQLTEGERTTPDKMILTFETTFPTEARVDYPGQTPHTCPHYFDSPVSLTGGVFYTISFDKQESAYIFYGSSITGNPKPFGEGNNNRITFKTAGCDNYDNRDDLGQFADFYLYS